MSWCIYLLVQKSVFCREMVFMLDFHLLKNAFTEEGIFLNANYSGKYYLSRLYNGLFFCPNRYKHPHFKYLLLSKKVATVASFNSFQLRRDKRVMVPYFHSCKKMPFKWIHSLLPLVFLFYGRESQEEVL